MKTLIFSLGLLMSSLWAHAQVMRILVTTPEKEKLALAFLEKQNEPFSLTIMGQGDKNAFQAHLAKQATKTGSQFKSLRNFTGPSSAVQLTCYGYYGGNQYRWNNWGWGTNYYQPSYNPYGWGNTYGNGWNSPWWQNGYGNQGFGRSGIGFGIFFGFF